MTKEQVIEWLGKFGKDWISFNRAIGDESIAGVIFKTEAAAGYLEYNMDLPNWDDPQCLRLTDKAMQLLTEEKQNG